MTDHTDGETIQSSWAYDKNDQALYVMQDGKVMGFGYNGVGEMTSIRYSAGNTMEIEGAVRTVTYEYDDLGRLTAVKRGEVDTSNETMAGKRENGEGLQLCRRAGRAFLPACQL